jgi:hypothetical protein
MSNKATKKKLCFVVGPIGSEDSEIRVHASCRRASSSDLMMAQTMGERAFRRFCSRNPWA